MKPLLLFFVLTIAFWACSSHGQDAAGSAPSTDTGLFIPAEKTGIGILQRNNEIALPPYGLEKVQKLVDSIHPVDDTSGDGEVDAISDRDYASLSLREKFTYHMINPELKGQMCDILPEREHEGSRIYGHLPNVFGEYVWSDRQEDFFKSNRDSVMALMKEMIEKDHKVAANLKAVMYMIDAREMIPFLTNTYYTTGKDHYILTLMMQLMEQGKFPEFTGSASHMKLYSDSVTYEYAAFLVYNKANEDLIIQRATRYYHANSAK